MQVLFDPTKFKSKAEWKLINDGLSRMDDQSAMRQIEKCGYVIDDGTVADESTVQLTAPAPTEARHVELTFVPVNEPLLTQKEKDDIMDDFMRSFSTDGIYVDMVENGKENLIDSYYRSKSMSKISYFDPKDITTVMEWDGVNKTGTTHHRIYRFSPNILRLSYGDKLLEPDLMMPQYVTTKHAPYNVLLVTCEKYNWSEAFAIDDNLKIPICITERLVGDVVSYWTGMSMINTRSFALFRSTDEVIEAYRKIDKDITVKVVRNSIKKILAKSATK